MKIGESKVLEHRQAIFIHSNAVWSLEELDLTGVWKDGTEGEWFLSYFANMSSLRRLNLMSNMNHSVLDLSDSLTGLQCLTYLGFRNCLFSQDFLILLAQEVRNLPRLKRLELPQEHMSAAVWRAPAPMEGRGVEIDTF